MVVENNETHLFLFQQNMHLFLKIDVEISRKYQRKGLHARIGYHSSAVREREYQYRLCNNIVHDNIINNKIHNMIQVYLYHYKIQYVWQCPQHQIC